MTTGVFRGGVCHYPITTAYSDACAAANVNDATGAYVQCASYTLPTANGAWMASTLTLRRYATTAATTYTQYTRPVSFEVCEVRDFAYWSPSIAAWTAALVAVVAAKTLYRKVFDRETL